MKTCLTLVLFSFCALTGVTAQRTMDLAAEIVAPTYNSSVQLNSPFTISIEVTNQGSENLHANDTLRFYLTVNGVTMTNMEYFTRTGQQINAGESETFQIPFVFSYGYENSNVDYCLEVVPVNAADPIEETNMADNKGCVFLYVDGGSTAQRTMDLAAEIVAPESGDTVQFNTPFNITVDITNQGTDHFTHNDTLYFYLKINGQHPENLEYFTRTGYQIDAGTTQTLLIPFTFSLGYENKTPEYCIEVVPVNAASPITEPNMEDNETCLTVFVNDESTMGIGNMTINDLILSSNPAQGTILLGVRPDNGEVQLVSSEGKQVMNAQLTGKSIDISELSNGVYLLNFKLENTPYSTRIVVSN